MQEQTITVEQTVNIPIEKAWAAWTQPEHIIQWNNASEDWHTPTAQNDLRKDGSFSFRMEAKDGSFGFDFGGIYTEVIPERLISYKMGDERKVTVTFDPLENSTRITETFDPENTHSLEMQRAGWQAILDNFKKYAESI